MREVMAIKAVHVSDVPNPESLLVSSRFSKGEKTSSSLFTMKPWKLAVVGHRGNGMNVLQAGDKRMTAIKENTVSSFNNASRFPIDFIEFDVQVTRDDCPVIFHDNFILAQENGAISEKRVTDLTLSEFLSYGPQRDTGKEGKSLLRKTKDGSIMSWNVEQDDASCTLQEAFQQVQPSLGFNIELKFDDHVVYHPNHLFHVLNAILQVVFDHAHDRPIIFSSFQPDAALLLRKLQNTYPVFFLTNGGAEIFDDKRRNSLEEAVKLCLDGGLQGIVSEVRGVFRNPGAVTKIKEAKLSLLTYGRLNNVSEAVYMQHLMGIDGVIVDLVEEITEAVKELIQPPEAGEESNNGEPEAALRPKFSQKELSFLLKLIPELIQQ